MATFKGDLICFLNWCQGPRKGDRLIILTPTYLQPKFEICLKSAAGAYGDRQNISNYSNLKGACLPDNGKTEGALSLKVLWNLGIEYLFVSSLIVAS